MFDKLDDSRKADRRTGPFDKPSSRSLNDVVARGDEDASLIELSNPGSLVTLPFREAAALELVDVVL